MAHSKVEVTERGKHPYFKFLKTTFTLGTVDSKRDTGPAIHLQHLLDIGEVIEYNKQKKIYELQGHKFRLTEMVLYETFPTDRTIEVKVAVQVKGYVINWYFWSPGNQDQYSQDFRDVLYNSAAEAHKKTSRGCNLYYRGSNGYHYATMHVKEIEGDHNHNHYRMKDNQPVCPVDFREHMMGMKNTQAFTDGFFKPDEIEELCDDFDRHYLMWTYKGQEGTDLSQEELYRASNQLVEADIIEFRMFGEQQEPCRLDVAELKLDFNRARKIIEERFTPSVQLGTPIDSEAVKAMELEITRLNEEFEALITFRKNGGSRAIGAEYRMTRQLPGSLLPTIPVIPKDDTIVKPPAIPGWAVSALAEVERIRVQIEKSYRRPEPSPIRVSETDVALFSQQKASSAQPISQHASTSAEPSPHGSTRDDPYMC